MRDVLRTADNTSVLSGYVLEIRDISLSNEWAEAHAGEIPVLFVGKSGDADDVETASKVRRPTPKVSAGRLKLDLERHVLLRGENDDVSCSDDGARGWTVISDYNKPF